MTTRDQLLRKIRLLHKRGEPLNITAVQRNHPELIAATYATKPFWGWAQALRDAGVNYKKINMDLLDVVPCRLCGKDYGNLTAHVRVHEVRPDEYKDVYPDDWMISEEFRARISYRMQRNDGAIPHWEPIWTPEYVLDRIHELHRRGIPLDHKYIRETERILPRAAENFFGTWEEALQKVGIDLRKEQIKAGLLRYNRVEVVAALKKRQKEKLPLNANAVRRDDPKLAAAVPRYFGSHGVGLLAAGIDPEKVRRVRQPYTEQEKKELLKEVRRVSRMPVQQRGAAIKALRWHYRGLVSRKFNSWSSVANAAGIPYRSIHPRDPRDFSSRKKAIEAMRMLGRSCQSIRLHKVRSRHTRLYDAVLRYFSDYYDCVLAAGVRRKDLPLRIQRYPSRKDVIAAIRERDELGLDLRSKVLHCGSAKERNSGLVKSAREFFGTWRAALIAAKIPKEKRRPGQVPRYLTAGSVLSEIRRRNRKGLTLSSHQLTKRGSRQKDTPLVLLPPTSSDPGLSPFARPSRAIE